MDRWLATLRGVALCVGLVLVAAPVCAQGTRPARPYRSLFGGNDSARRSLHSLDLRVTLNGAVDDGLTTPAPATPPTAAATQYEQFYNAGLELSYARRGRRVEAKASGVTNLPYYSIFPDTWDLAYGADGSIGIASRATSLNLFGRYFYSPFYSLALEPGNGVGPRPPGGSFDYASALNPNGQTTAGASLTRRVGRRTSLAFAYDIDSMSFADEDRWSRNQSARVSVDHSLSRAVAVTGGYLFRDTDFETGGTPTSSQSHDVDLGLGFSRRTLRDRTGTLRVGVGASTVDIGGGWYPGWRGSVGVSQDFGAGWMIAADYRRSLDVYGGLQEPVWADVASVSTAGRFGPRVNVNAAATYSIGQPIAEGGPNYDIYSVNAQAQVAVAAFAAITVDYIYYRYNFPAGYDLPAGMPPNMDRHRVQVGVRFWLPLVRAGRASEPIASQSQ
jgi:hypothetical protein